MALSIQAGANGQLPVSLADTSTARRGPPILYILLVFSLASDGLPIPLVSRTPDFFLAELILFLLIARLALIGLRRPGTLLVRDRYFFGLPGLGLFLVVYYVFLLVSMAAILVSPDILRSLASLRPSVESILLVFLVWVDLRDDYKAIRQVLLAVTVLGTVIALTTLANSFVAFDGNIAAMLNWNKSYAAKSVIVANGWQNNTIGSVLALTIAVTLGTTRSYRGIMKWGHRIALLLMLFALLVTSSSGAWLSLFVGIGLVFLARRSVLGILVGLYLVALTSLIFWISPFEQLLPLWDKLAHSLETRISLVWTEGLQAFLQHPLFGIGRGIARDVYTTGMHNSILTSFVESGILSGLLFILLLLLLMARLIGLGIGAGQGRSLTPLVIGLQYAIVVGVLNSFGEILLESVRYAILFWMLVGLAYATPLSATPNHHLGT